MINVILMGMTASGKTTIAQLLMGMGFHKVVTDTTRPMRSGEVDGIDYNFVSEDKFKENIENDIYIEYQEYDATFGHCYYGTRKGSFYTDNNTVCILTPSGVKALKEQGYPIVVVYIDVDTDIIKKRLRKRGDSSKEIKRRLENDIIDFKDADKLADYVIVTPNRTPKELANIVKAIADKEDK